VVTASGIAVGVVGAVVVGRMVRSQLFGVTATDPVTLIVAAVAFLGVAVVASWVPARRAAGVSPVTALREE
jgi:putative ABC transport system permease protein